MIRRGNGVCAHAVTKLGAIASLVLVSASVAVAGVVLHVDSRAAAGGDGTSWSSAFADLQQAVAVAGPGDEVRVATGTYRPAPAGGDRSVSFELRARVALRGGYAGIGAPDPDARDTMEHPSVLSGDLNGDDAELIPPQTYEWSDPTRAENTFQVLRSKDVPPDGLTVLDGFVITGGNALDTGGSAAYAGGGMYNDSASPLIVDCVFRANVADQGGAMANIGGSPTIRGCRFQHNLAWYSGAMENRNGDPEITDCVFEDNVGIDQGGCVGNFGGSPLLVRSTFLRNSSSEMGGAMQNREDTTPTLVGCSFIENSSDEGAGIENRGGSPSLDGCIFIGNQARGGAAMLNDNPEDSPPITVRNCIFAKNSAEWSNAAIDDWRSTLFVFNSVFADNWARNTLSSGGAVGVGRNALVRNCVFWGNRQGMGDIEHAQIEKGPEAVLDIGFSCVEGWTGSLGGEGNIGLDPLFLDAAAGDYRVLRWSPVVDTGSCDGAPAHDIEGNPRPAGSGCDMGAYEQAGVDFPAFRRGDANGDGLLDVGDAVCILGFLFRGDPARLGCAKASDLDDGGDIDIRDPIQLLFFLFAEGQAPAPPYPGCGDDVTSDALACWSYPPCG